MLLVDDREGSAYLLEPLQKLGLPAVMTRLDSADLAFEGKGLDGKTLNIGIEFKRLGDLSSSLRTGRLSGEQLPKMLGEHGAYDYAWLLIEGRWKVDKRGQVIVPGRGRRRFSSAREEWKPLPGNMNAAEMQKRVFTLAVAAGMQTQWVNERTDTLHFIHNLYRWWTDKSLDQHLSHLDVHEKPSFLSVSKWRQALMKLPRIGRRASLAAERHFRSFRDAVNAPPQIWAGLEVVTDKGKSRRLGTKVAEEIYEFCNQTMEQE